MVILNYRWFDGFNWEGLRARSLTTPILPKIQNHLDTSNFDEYPTDADGPPPGKSSRMSQMNIFFISQINFMKFVDYMLWWPKNHRFNIP